MCSGHCKCCEGKESLNAIEVDIDGRQATIFDKEEGEVEQGTHPHGYPVGYNENSH